MKYYTYYLLILLFIISSCEKKDKNNPFALNNKKIEDSIEINTIKNGTLLDVIYNKAKTDKDFVQFKESAVRVNEISNNFNKYLEDLKTVIKEKNTTEFVDELFFNEGEITAEGNEFLNYIENYKSSMISTVVLSNPDIAGMIKSTFDIGYIEDRRGNQTNYLSLNYKGFPAIASVIKLSEMQAKVKQIETNFYSSLLKVKLKKIKGEGQNLIKEKTYASNTQTKKETPKKQEVVKKVKIKKETPKKEVPEKVAPNKETTKKSFHTVGKGDTVYKISKKYGITTTKLKKMNGLTNNNLVIGQKLKIK